MFTASGIKILIKDQAGDAGFFFHVSMPCLHSATPSSHCQESSPSRLPCHPHDGGSLPYLRQMSSIRVWACCLPDAWGPGVSIPPEPHAEGSWGWVDHVKPIGSVDIVDKDGYEGSGEEPQSCWNRGLIPSPAQNPQTAFSGHEQLFIALNKGPWAKMKAMRAASLWQCWEPYANAVVCMIMLIGSPNYHCGPVW